MHEPNLISNSRPTAVFLRVCHFRSILAILLLLQYSSSVSIAQTEVEKDALQAELVSFQRQIDQQVTAFQSNPATSKDEVQQILSDIKVFAKAVEWILRHDEFYSPDYLDQAKKALQIGRNRLAAWRQNKRPSWQTSTGRSVLAYRSKVDHSIQPYAISLPDALSKPQNGDPRRWPLHVVLHGRAGKMNEVNFIHRHHGKKAETQDWIQLDVFGRTNNAYRWSGETDVFEAIEDVKKRYAIDEDRVTLRGFSMGGAGAWHLGMHYPDLWSSVGPGAGFVDFYKYQNQSKRRPDYQHRTLGIYDSIDYAMNAANVPVCTYGGEKDKQLVASTSMVKAAAKHGIDIQLLVGKGMGHKFDPASRKAFMAFHIEKSIQGRPKSPRPVIRFQTKHLRYNRCDWIEIIRMERPYLLATVDASLEDSVICLQLENVAELKVTLKQAGKISVNGTHLQKPEGLVHVVKTDRGWKILTSSAASAGNEALRKTKGLSGPIDDAFRDSFVCVRGTGEPWSEEHEAWAEWNLKRFEQEFDKWLRGRIRVVNDTDVTVDMMLNNHLILFGDPGSNSVIKQVHDQLPLKWTKNRLTVNRHLHEGNDISLALVYPNPLQPKRYVVLNSGHTIHDADFKNSNAWLFPRFGDIAVQRFKKDAQKGYSTEVLWSEIFNSRWKFDEPKLKDDE